MMGFWVRLLLPGILLMVLSLSAQAAGEPILDRMSKQDDLAGTRIQFNFSSLPAFRVVNSGQRVDLFFQKSRVGPKLRLLAEDDKIVRVLLAKTGDELMVSLLLRKMPARVSADGEKNSMSVNVDIFWEEDGGARPAVAFRIAGVPRRQENPDISSPSTLSKYKGQWRQFFDLYQTPFHVDAPLHYSIPNLPIPPKVFFPAGSESLLAKVARGDWPGVNKQLQPPVTNQQPSPPLKVPHRLLYAEALLRTGKPKKALAILQDLQPAQLPAGLRERMAYLHGLALAKCGDTFGANIQLSGQNAGPNPAEYRPFKDLLASELALARGKYRLALDILSRKENWPGFLTDIRNLRIADALVGRQERVQALTLYRSLPPASGFPHNRPFSLRQAAWAAFRENQWQEAIYFYQQLAAILPVDRMAGQAFYGAAIAEYRAGNTTAALQRFRLIREKFANTESDFRAWIKLLDHGMLSGEERHLLQAIREYDVIAVDAQNRNLREEATFKLGLALYLHGEHDRSVKVMEKFRREFAAGLLRSEAEAFMAEILPPMIEKLVAEGQEMKAVILVEKNRELLINASSTWQFLPELAQAFSRLGLFERGCKVYLYLLERTKNRPDADRFYPPLISLYFDQQEYEMVDRYVDRYMVLFPKGKDLHDLFLMRLSALSKLGRAEQAAELLKGKNRPSNNQIELVGTRIFWQAGDYSQVIECAKRLGNSGKPVPAEALLLQAEAMRRLGRGERALPLFELLTDDLTYGDQASYRSAEILLSAGKRIEALKLFRKLAEKGDDPLWRKLAQDALEASRY